MLAIQLASRTDERIDEDIHAACQPQPPVKVIDLFGWCLFLPKKIVCSPAKLAVGDNNPASSATPT